MGKNSTKLQKANTVFARYIICRDGFKCVICGSIYDLQCGHYFSRGNHSTLFDEINCNCQCRTCNNLHEEDPEPYRLYLISKYGVEEFEALEARHYQVKQYKDWELDEIIEQYS